MVGGMETALFGLTSFEALVLVLNIKIITF